ncbi:hypothetical protein POM88_045085 [Heracleum sosnowskyi]|uniref:Uncharacterized protein n=1 Tax=Heracleum sosnowskyi TaxID=360622 RepID=A0AAD8H6D4_9APIA|nr:hypothetical protein POM88_045085 [Heracleum sosnowskyi]
MINNEWGAWLRAPPRRSFGGGRSKWLREDGDGDWSGNSGSDNYYQQDLGDPISTNKETERIGKEVVSIPNLAGRDNVVVKISKVKEGKQVKYSGTGPQEDEELSGLLFEERKRQRSEMDGPFERTIAGNSSKPGSRLSDLDYPESSPQFLATLAMQASQSK